MCAQAPPTIAAAATPVAAATPAARAAAAAAAVSAAITTSRPTNRDGHRADLPAFSRAVNPAERVPEGGWRSEGPQVRHEKSAIEKSRLLIAQWFEKAPDMHLTLEFGGGLELLFGSQKRHEVDVAPADGLKEVTMESLLSWIKDNLVKERPEMFLKENSVRPGVLVLVNDSDWELCGQLETVLEDNDEVIFISTLHGG